ncbi:MAG: Gfo/Idh/MocA family protein [Deltaproteobacteria bacterium]
MSTAESSRPVRWGILGTARIASKVGRAIYDARGARLVAVASRELPRARAWIDQHTVGHAAADEKLAFLSAGDAVAAYGSYLELLRQPDIDAVYLPLPPSLHCEWTCCAAQHGKHVLCEKPLALNFAEAERMRDACQSADRQLMDGVMWVHHERTAAMQKVLSSGDLGRLRRVTSGFSFNASDFRPDNIRFQRELGGGALGDLGWYCVRATLWALDDLPEKVFATARYERDVDMNVSATLWFRGERMASFDCGFDTTWRKWFEIAGTEGSLVCDDFVNPWDVSKARFWTHNSQGKATQHDFAGCIQEVRMIERFCEIVRSGATDSAWPVASIATQRVCDALARSARSGRVVELG